MLKFNAYRVSDDEVWAATSVNDAISDYEKSTGKLSHNFVSELSVLEIDRIRPVSNEDGLFSGHVFTIRQLLNKVKQTGFLAMYYI